jgi:hypothetical protein
MSIIVAGFVKNGVVVPNAPLPEGAFVEVHVVDDWERAGAGTIEMVERLAEDMEANEKG